MAYKLAYISLKYIIFLLHVLILFVVVYLWISEYNSWIKIIRKCEIVTDYIDIIICAYLNKTPVKSANKLYKY